MCGCEKSFVCSRCKGTRDDWRYWQEDPPSPQEEADQRKQEHSTRVVLPSLDGYGK